MTYQILATKLNISNGNKVLQDVTNNNILYYNIKKLKNTRKKKQMQNRKDMFSDEVVYTKRVLLKRETQKKIMTIRNYSENKKMRKKREENFLKTVSKNIKKQSMEIKSKMFLIFFSKNRNQSLMEKFKLLKAQRETKTC